jgi:hypothetical protein
MRSLGIPRHKSGDIKMNLREIQLESVNWIQLAQDRDHWQVVLKTVMNLQVP